MSYSPKIDKLLSVATELGFTEEDFADLAIAAADQSGASLSVQLQIANCLGIPFCPACGGRARIGHMTCGRDACEAAHQ